VKLLLDAYAEVNLKDNKTLLSLAAQYGYSEVIKLLLDAHTKVDLKNNK